MLYMNIYDEKFIKFYISFSDLDSYM